MGGPAKKDAMKADSLRSANGREQVRSRVKGAHVPDSSRHSTFNDGLWAVAAMALAAFIAFGFLISAIWDVANQ